MCAVGDTKSPTDMRKPCRRLLLLLRCLRFGVAVLVAKHGLAGKLYLVAFLADALNEDLLAFFQFVPHVLYATVRDLRNVQ